MTEFSHMDAETVLNYVHPMNETTPMCLQLRIKLAPASADR